MNVASIGTLSMVVNNRCVPVRTLELTPVHIIIPLTCALGV